MNTLKLHLPEQDTEWPLHEGMHALVRDGRGLRLGGEGDAPAVRLCLDRRGAWLTVPADGGSVHVNGRRIRRMALLRMGDAIYVDGTELRLVAGQDIEQPDGSVFDTAPAAAGDPRVVLRGVGGKHHGRSIALDVPRVVGSAADVDIRIDDPAFGERHAQLSVLNERVVLRDLGSPEGTRVNGRLVRDALLQAGDQLEFDARHRFVLEAPGKAVGAGPLLQFALPPEEDGAGVATGRRWRRWPWLLLAAGLIACSLVALLMFGSSR